MEPENQNPYSNNQIPPAYHGQFPNEEDLLKKYKSNPRYVAARDLIGTPYVLMYALSVSAMLIYFAIQKDFLHPFYILLCIGSWITYISAVKSKKTNELPSVSGLGLCAGVSIALLVVICIGVGVMLLILIVCLVSIFKVNSGDGQMVLTVSILLAVSGLLLWLCIKLFSVQARNIKTIKHCISNDDFIPKKISIFPSIVYFITSGISLFSIFAINTLSGSLTSYFEDTFKTMKETLLSTGVSNDLVNTFIDEIQKYVNDGSLTTSIIISSILGMINNVSLALFYFRAASALNVYLSDY